MSMVNVVHFDELAIYSIDDLELLQAVSAAAATDPAEYNAAAANSRCLDAVCNSGGNGACIPPNLLCILEPGNINVVCP